MDVTAYYTELVTLWEEHKNFVDLPVCTCGKCECNAAKSWETLQERSRVIKFLMGLNEAYESTRRQILMIKPFPSIEDVFNMITQDERQNAIKPSSKTDSVVFQTTGSDLHAEPFDNPVFASRHQHGYRPKQRPLCTHCGQYGHIVQKCFKIHGYPPGHPFHGQAAKGQSQQFTPRGQSHGGFPRQPHQQYQIPQTNAVANVTSAPMPSHAAPSTSRNLDLSQLNND